MLIITLLVALIPAPASAQGSGYGVKGKSRVEVSDIFVSGGSEYAFSLNYRATDALGLLVGFETLSGSAVSGTGFGVGLAYYPPVMSERFEPYLFAGFVTATVTITGVGTGSGSGVQFEVGATGRVSDLVTLCGSVYVTSLGGSSTTNFDAGLRFNLAEELLHCSRHNRRRWPQRLLRRFREFVLRASLPWGSSITATLRTVHSPGARKFPERRCEDVRSYIA